MENQTKDIFNIFETSFVSLRNVFKVFVLELKLAGYSTVMLLMLLVALAFISLSTWTGFNVFCALLFYHFSGSALLSTFLLFLINVMLGIFVVFLVKRNVVHYQFKQTRTMIDGINRDKTLSQNAQS